MNGTEWYAWRHRSPKHFSRPNFLLTPMPFSLVSPAKASTVSLGWVYGNSMPVNNLEPPMDKPLVAFLTNNHASTICFSQRDLERLAERCAIRMERPERVAGDAVADMGRGADIWVTGWGTPRLPLAAFDAAPALRLVAHSAGSTKGLLPEGFWSRGVALTTANGALAVSVAEGMLGFLIASSKRMWQYAAHTRAGRWRQGEELEHVRELYETTVGVVAASRVGKHFLRLLGQFEVHKLLYDPYVTVEQATALGAEKIEDLLAMAPRCDYLAICAPALDATRHLISAEVLQALPEHCTVINASRGAVIDEPALVAELQRGRLFACLDVTDPEPPPEDSLLRRLPNVILTPHITGSIRNACCRQGRFVIDDILRFLDGRPMEWGVTESQWRIMA